jgi:DNA-binding MarR family transcriptional regulator
VPNGETDHRRPHPEPRFASARPFIGRGLRDAWSHFTTELAEGIRRADAGTTPAMNQVMIVIDLEGTRVGELARRAGVTKQAMAEAVAGLERRGYVRRQPDPSDGRAQLVQLTEAGQAALRRGRAVAESIHDRWTALLGEREMERLVNLLERLTERLDAEI